MAVKKTILATVVASAAGAATVLLRNGESRERACKAVRETYAKMKGGTADNHKKDNQTKVGHSHPHDYEDNKMVNEGALTSVKYYNEKQQQ
ncbi:hypothetical protein [Halalkalibacter nanhaiisediminis]|uniref:Uncharacterized protein n=1 Tax=Halalkalibacter nanhaiisediminis TaxID=688079 RepID=A0A562QLX2_9BACI|nr:hypothetical protein [Halalkalibacter nanhaiisediminis]TWI57190.1 hypothetical protein IQ10_01896 [Halalkalibacter nanhaiisediminis]